MDEMVISCILCIIFFSESVSLFVMYRAAALKSVHHILHGVALYLAKLHDMKCSDVT